MCKPFSLRWVPSMEELLSCACLNYAANAHSSSSSGKHFNKFCCLEKGSHWIKLLLISSQFFTIGFSVGIESLKCDACSTCFSICTPTCAQIFILSLIVGDSGFPLLFIFHPLAEKFISVYNKLRSLQDNLTQLHLC
jgi:hypothetical protein